MEQNSKIAVFSMYNKSDGEDVIITLRKSLIMSVIEYPNYYTVHYSTGGSFDSSYKVKKDFGKEEVQKLFE